MWLSVGKSTTTVDVDEARGSAATSATAAAAAASGACIGAILLGVSACVRV